MRLLFLLTAFIALAACKPAPLPAQGPGVLLVLEIDGDRLRRDRLFDLSAAVREELRRQPMIVLNPLDGRRVEGDRLLVRLGKPENSAAAIERVRKIAPADMPGSLVFTEAPEGAIEVRLTEVAVEKLKADMVPVSVNVLRRRIGAAGFRGASVEAQEGGRIEARIPGLEDPQADFVELLTAAGDLSFNLVDEEANFSEYRPGVENNGRIALPDDGSIAATQIVFVDPIVRGADLSGASAIRDEANRPAIAFQLNPVGAERFAQATSENVGNLFAIVLDDRIVSAPRIIGPITGGNGQITGQFAPEEAERMAIILRSGSLPVRLKLVKSEVVTE